MLESNIFQNIIIEESFNKTENPFSLQDDEKIDSSGKTLRDSVRLCKTLQDSQRLPKTLKDSSELRLNS